ncbi:oligosaccharide flippase family protein [Oceaniglobus trochenteri]|uniref:oligosaccharide flippase family protein n=1 Tax=Oceaniglobus trochenteri TaxID=2763260 RepID=UPI001CFFD14F|nr:oligosaccharide flippase family protein [Oceaniglobus trochenteri]
MKRLMAAMQGNRLMARAMRSSSWILIGYSGSQGMRLAANLVLTRLLFPEAFGMMALVSVVTVGLAMFSDVGISPSISQSRRGDDPDFLNTAWTIQVIRGFGLWLAACVLAWPVAMFYGEPDLALYLPLAGVSLAIAGFNPTRIETAHRHLLVGRLTVLDLASQAIGVLAMIALAAALQSVMALVIGGVVGVLAKLVLTHFGLPGLRNRFRWERAAANELIKFGKWIFLSTAFWFLSSQGDKAILGKFLPLNTLGVYNIGYFLAAFPLALGQAVTGKVLIPIYRDTPPNASPENARKLRKMRYTLGVPIMVLLTVMAFLGPEIVDLLYDARYVHAGAILVLLAAAQIPQVIGLSYDQAALAAGDSRRFFVFSCSRAVLQVGFILIGVAMFGLIGALVGLGLSTLLTHPVAIWLARHHRVWDPVHDLVFFGYGAVVAALSLWLHWGQILAMIAAT